jgi:hypothetical protein
MSKRAKRHHRRSSLGVPTWSESPEGTAGEALTDIARSFNVDATTTTIGRLKA